MDLEFTSARRTRGPRPRPDPGGQTMIVEVVVVGATHDPLIRVDILDTDRTAIPLFIRALLPGLRLLRSSGRRGGLFRLGRRQLSGAASVCLRLVLALGLLSQGGPQLGATAHGSIELRPCGGYFAAEMLLPPAVSLQNALEVLGQAPECTQGQGPVGELPQDNPAPFCIRINEDDSPLLRAPKSPKTTPRTLQLQYRCLRISPVRLRLKISHAEFMVAH
mmetsp:Transcript_6181/g.14824  ORF Transcript_6181/g.14824 Transcript_6181/m.14824 type:complete len:220 (+) Transcript_6181:664-1323(+)